MATITLTPSVVNVHRRYQHSSDSWGHETATSHLFLGKGFWSEPEYKQEHRQRFTVSQSLSPLGAINSVYMSNIYRENSSYQYPAVTGGKLYASSNANLSPLNFTVSTYEIGTWSLTVGTGAYISMTMTAIDIAKFTSLIGTASTWYLVTYHPTFSSNIDAKIFARYGPQVRVTIDHSPFSIKTNVNGSWKDGDPWTNVSGSWKKGEMWTNVSGTWKKGTV